MKNRTGWLIAAVGAQCLGSTPAVADPTALVQGVSQITAVGLPGPVYPMSNAWWPIAAGDDDATFPSLYVAARDYGAGRVVIVGHGGVVANTDVLDNGAFALNVMNWLNVAGTGDLRYTTGHSEWNTGAALSGLVDLVAGQGMSLSALPAPIDAAALAGVSVVIAGNAWGDFTAGEIEAVRQWVEGGGGLLLVGLGWSWEPYHPGTTLEDYPMMQLAQPYEVRWLRNIITDPTDQHEGSAVFHTFYPDIEIATIDDAIATIDSIHAAQGAGLPDALEADSDLRLQFVRSHQTLAIPASEFPEGHAERQDVFDAYANLMTAEPGFYPRDFSFDESVHPTSTWIRERAWRTWRDCLELTPARKTQMIALGQLSGGHMDVFNDFGVILLDNARLSPAQTGVIHDLLSVIPADLYFLRAISVHAFLGAPPIPISLSGLKYAVNIFGVEVGAVSENSFPGDVEPGLIDLFSGALAHEVNHVVDAWTIGGSPELSQRRDALIAAAGDEPMNYLRSMFPPGTFVDAPQEFFASISNQWFTDSRKTVELGLVRFDAGWLHPINQAIFFAEVYSQGGDSTWFYTIDTSGNVTAESVVVRRNIDGFINELVYDGQRLVFTLDGEGDVQSYVVTTFADVNADCTVDVLDLIELLLCFGQAADSSCATADITQDGVVNVLDLIDLLVAFGTTCP